MPGGLFQLSAYGDENQYLNGNPQMSYFRAVYKRYANFAMEFIEISLKGPIELKLEEVSVFRAKVPRNGELLNQLFITLELPDIYSDDISQFQWVENLGFAMLKYAKVYVGGQLIQHLTGEWIQAYYQLNATFEKQQIINEMIGNTPFVYDPRATNAFTYIYPASSNNPPYQVSIPSSGGKTAIMSDENMIFNGLSPSIRRRTIYIPVPFWFTKNMGTSLPLISLEYDDVDIEFGLRGINEIFTYREYTRVLGADFNPNDDTRVGENEVYQFQLINKPGVQTILYPTGRRIRPPVDSNIFYSFLEPQTLYSANNIESASGIINCLEFLLPPLDPLKTKLWLPQVSSLGLYIMLEDQEKRIFSTNTNEYIVDQIEMLEFEDVQEGTRIFELEYYNPIKEIIITPIRSNYLRSNRWMNYTRRERIYTETFEYQNDLTRTYSELLRLGYTWMDGIQMKNPFALYSFSTGLLIKNHVINNKANTLPFYGISVTTSVNSYNAIHRFRDRWDYRHLNEIPAINISNYELYSDSLVLNGKIRFNKDTTREETKETIFWDVAQPYLYHTKPSSNGVLSYSFSLHPDATFPSGNCLFSELKHIDVYLTLAPIPNIVDWRYAPQNIKDYSYVVRFYMNAMNIIRFANGMGRMIYGN